jgi:hypothetical protein
MDNSPCENKSWSPIGTTLAANGAMRVAWLEAVREGTRGKAPPAPSISGQLLFGGGQ